VTPPNLLSRIYPQCGAGALRTPERAACLTCFENVPPPLPSCKFLLHKQWHQSSKQTISVSHNQTVIKIYCTPAKYEMLNLYANPWRCSAQSDFIIDRDRELSVVDSEVTAGGKGPTTTFCQQKLMFKKRRNKLHDIHATYVTCICYNHFQ